MLRGWHDAFGNQQAVIENVLLLSTKFLFAVPWKDVLKPKISIPHSRNVQHLNSSDQL